MGYTGKKPTNVVDVSETQSLTVDGDLTIADKIVHSGDTNTAIRFADADTVTVETAGSERLRISSAGFLGVGTTAPENPIEIETTNKLGGTFTGTTDGEGLRVTQTDYTSGNYVSLVEAPYDDSNSSANVRIGAMFDGGGSNLAFGTSNSYGSGITNTAMFIDSSGLVGVGTTAPASLIHGMDGDLFLTDNSTSADSGQAVYFQSTTSGWATSSAHAAIFGKRVDASNGYLRFDTRSSGTTAERMRIDESGNVLIGKTGTAVAGANGAIIKPNGQYFSTTSGANTYHYYDDSNSRYNFYVLGNGGIANYSSNNIALSDQTEKKNIVTASSAWDNVTALSVKQFHYNFEDDSDPKRLGVIAQDIQVNHPSLVTSFEIDESTTKLGVVEQQITWMAVKALQEAMERIETLETKVAALEG